MILKKAPGVFLGVLSSLWLAASVVCLRGADDSPPPDQCDPALARSFIPQTSFLGRYLVCADRRPISELAAGATVEALEPIDAFGRAGPYDRLTLSRLYGGLRARVAHRWVNTPDRFEAVTFISPYPNGDLTRLEPGTLVIRWICERTMPGCNRLDPR